MLIMLWVFFIFKTTFLLKKELKDLNIYYILNVKYMKDYMKKKTKVYCK